MYHTFDTDVAAKYGIFEAVLLALLLACSEQASREGFADETLAGAYQSVKTLSEFMPYASEKKIRCALNDLHEKRLLKTASFGTNKFDRTLWYALSDEGKRVLKNPGGADRVGC